MCFVKGWATLVQFAVQLRMLPALSDEGRCGRIDLRAELLVLDRKHLFTGRATECATHASRAPG